MDEKKFLSSYNIKNYNQVSITTDIVTFSMYGEESESHRKDSEPRLYILLIKRGEHPFMNSWALPGGFLKEDETVEACAYREIVSETNCIPSSLIPIGVFSEKDRDPRGRIISNAYLSIIGDGEVDIVGGDDAIDAKWFDVSYKIQEDGMIILELSRGEEVIKATLVRKDNKFGTVDFDIVESEGFAFDHAKIIATAIIYMRNEAKNIEFIFDFLPEKFTLAALQKIQENLMNVTLTTANFRRKIADYVIETDEFYEGAGHRPARLFKRR